MIKNIAIIFLCVLSLLSLSIASGTTSFQDVQNVEEYASRMGSPIAVDSNNTVHILYTLVTKESFLVIYASQNGSDWDKQTVATDAIGSSLVLDSHGNPHILYFANPISDITPLMYAKWTGTNWEVKDTGIKQLGEASLALDQSDNPHIAYIGNNKVEYASWVQYTWRIQIVDSCSYDLGKVSLALDEKGTPFLLYQHTIFGDADRKYQNLNVAHLTNSDWVIQNFTTYVNDFSNIVVDSSGCFHFACQELFPTDFSFYNSTLLYVSWNGTNWNTEPLVSKVYIESFGSLVLDSNDNPHIFYILTAPEGQTQTVYATRNDATWDMINIGSNRTLSGACLFAFDSYGNVHVSYRPLSGARFTAPVMYATIKPTPLPTDSPVGTDDGIILIVSVSAVLLLALVSIIVYRNSKKH